MEQYALSNEQITILKKHGEEFHKWRETEPGKEKIQEHIDHGSYFKLKLAPQNISQITKPELIEIYKHLWASGFWKNKEWKINNIIEKNSLDVIKRELNILLYGKESFEKRYSSFRNKIKGFGISAISEILGMVYPDEFCIWNGKTKKVLTFLNLKKNLPESSFKNNNITGGEYAQCINYLLTIKSELISYEINNFIDLDTFFWYLHENVIPEGWKEESSLNFEKGQERLHEVLTKFNEMDTKFWVVRAGPTGLEEKDALDNNVITIGYGLHDFSSVKNKGEIIDTFLNNPVLDDKLYFDERRLSAAQNAEQIWNFLKDIKKDDVIVLPLKSRQSEKTAIGIVKGDYEYRDISKNVKSIRPVEWLNKEIPTSEFDETTLRFLRLPRTVFRIKSSHAVRNIIDVMNKHQILPEFLKSYYNSTDRKTGSAVEWLPKQIKISLEELSEQTYISSKKLKEIEYLFDEKKQIIFYGPPGTSKTFVAKKFAEYFVNDKKEYVQIVQFHPSYSYEDFIEGIKPKLSSEGEAIGFIKQPGIFKTLVEKCMKNSDKRFVLIIDEINRGNISKIFGELIYLLEYRNDKIRLTYSPNEEFYIPGNLYIIGTMNSADRSIAFVDYALRRRFYFVDFYPDSNMEILSKWLNNNYKIKQINPEKIVNLLNELNAVIEQHLGREYEIGYSYFMNENLSYEHLERIKDYAIIPLIQQYFFGKKKNIEEIQNIFKKYLNPNQEIGSSEESNT